MGEQAGQQEPFYRPMPTCLYQDKSEYNPNIQVLQFPEEGFPPQVAGARLLFLDHSGNVHSVYREGRSTTGAYWDELATLEAVVPEGPMAVLGLAAGTVVHLFHSFAPSRVIHGVEIDGAVVKAAREFLGLKALEDSNHLVIHIGDAFAGGWEVDGGFSGIVVDIFVDAAVHDELLKVETWQRIAGCLAPGGRVIANLGSAPFPGTENSPPVLKAKQALKAMEEAFGGDLCYKYSIENQSGSTIGLSGPCPEATSFASLPESLRGRFEGWKKSSELEA